eukprot:CAMPEP_0170747360 /NCGR_PEP_ID=MMETSP0437-20130122/9280_1 /TAXON_ID=0 /ORGANISM="Sexangularia sp." /LENGTH=349 /DNA_ID=CAMNT_0011086131 /DNA_START=88 /DNA_END=1134 /DNA_ORIENTATION=+
MAGLLLQLDALAGFSAQLFGELATAAAESANRITTVQQRAARLLDVIPAVQEKLGSTSLTKFHAKSSKTFRPSSSAWSEAQSHVTRQSIPPPLAAIHSNQCNPLPSFDLVDRAIGAKDGTTGSLYSNPGFFFDSWVAEQMRLAEEEKKARQEKKAARKKAKKAGKKGEKGVVKKPARLQRAQYDPTTGEKITTPMSASSATLAVPATTPLARTSSSKKIRIDSQTEDEIAANDSRRSAVSTPTVPGESPRSGHRSRSGSRTSKGGVKEKKKKKRHSKMVQSATPDTESVPAAPVTPVTPVTPGPPPVPAARPPPVPAARPPPVPSAGAPAVPPARPAKPAKPAKPTRPK